MENQELQQKYMEFQLLGEQMKQTQKQIQVLEEQMTEIVYTQQSLDSIKDLKKGDQILVPVSNGIFAEATITNTEKLIVNVGANTMVQKSVESAKEMLSQQVTEVSNLHIQLHEMLGKIEEELQGLQRELSKSGE